jgi:hypothetical protein
MPSESSRVECIDSFHAFDDSGHAFDVEECAVVSYSINESGTCIRSVLKKYLRMAESGNIVNPHLDGTLVDSGTGRRLRMNHGASSTGSFESRP